MGKATDEFRVWDGETAHEYAARMERLREERARKAREAARRASTERFRAVL
jgi:hypothetical protein